MPHKVSKLRLPEPTVLAAYPYYLQEICSESVQNHDSENPDLLPGFSFFAEICGSFAARLRNTDSDVQILVCGFSARGVSMCRFGVLGPVRRVPHVILVRGAARSSSPAIRRAGRGVLGLWRMRFST